MALFLNTRVPPFDNLAVRRALNYAIDRRKALAAPRWDRGRVGDVPDPAARHARLRAALPVHAEPGQRLDRSRPRLARKLVASSGTRGEKVVVWTVAHPSRRGDRRRLAVETLDELGYRASLKLLPCAGDVLHALSTIPRTRAQAGLVGWSADYPAASNFLSLFTCHAAASGNPSASQLCDRGLDRAIDRAFTAQSQDSPSASTSWASVDRLVVELAPWVPLVNNRQVVVVSRRVGNVQYNPEWGTLIDQLWVR